MHLRSLFQYLSILAVVTLIPLTGWTQTARKSVRQRKAASAKPVRVDLVPDGRSRKSMGSIDRNRRTSANQFSASTRQTVDEKKNPQPVISKLKKAGSFDGDLRNIPYQAPIKIERPEREGPEPNPRAIIPPKSDTVAANPATPTENALAVAAPAPLSSFDGLDFANFGSGHPPDTNGDVGPLYYIQTINATIGIYNKTTGARVSATGFNAFMSQGNFGNLCDTNNFGDPVVLYDSFEDRWVISDFAFSLDGSGNVINPPGNFQCIAVSKNGDPVTGGWNFYSINTTGGLGDYPKFGIWTDAIYMSANMFDYAASGSFQNPRVFAFNKAQMYAGAPTVQVVSFDAPSTDFTVLPSNARLQTGTPPTGTPNYFVSTASFLNAASIYKFHVDWDHPSLATFTGPTNQLEPNCWPNAAVANAATPVATNSLDVISLRAMVQNQYSNISGAESLWVAHTVQRGVSATNTTCNATTGGNAAPRWYQINVTGGTVAANMVQGATWDPEAANTFFRYVPSVAVNRDGDMAMGYSKSNSATNPQVKYAGRLAGDTLNTFGFTEQTLIDGTGTQSGNCGGSPCTRWGDYTSMTLDPDGCTFWYTNEYFVTTGLDHQTRIGSFGYPGCVPLDNDGGLQGTVRSSTTNLPLEGVTVSLGSRSTATDAGGNYSFANLPQGLYQSESASFAGYTTGMAANIVISDGSNAVQDFTLSPAADSNCFTDASQTDFQTGTLNNTDITTNPGDVTLTKPDVIDQENLSVSPTGFVFTNTSWAGQTFTPAVTGQLTRVAIELFCSACSGTNPNITVSIRATTTGPNPVPTGSDLATTTLAGFNDGGAGGFKSVTFASPATVTAGARYALVFGSTAARTGSYAYTCSCSPNSNPYANGQRVTSGNSGSTWTIDNTSGGRDLKFVVYVNQGYTSGDFTSGVKDSNPSVPGTTIWSNLSWTANTPANTAVAFQAAASDSPYGPFNFVGPGGSSSTFFSNGGSLAQFNGFRYLKYKAFLSTTNNAVTPALNDVTVCDHGPRVWTGAVSSDWNNAANWSSSGVPGATDVANIPSTGVLNNPASGINVSVNQLIIGDGRIVDLGSNSLTVNDCSSSGVSGGSTTSFVKGKLIRCVNGSGPYVFPVGTAAGYAPVTLSGTVGAGTFTVNPVDGVLLGADSTKTIHRYWDLTPSGVSQASITFNYQASDVPGGSDESTFKILKRDTGGTFAFTPDFASPTTHTFSMNNVVAFSSWSVGTLLAPTAAGVTVSGRAVNQSGYGVDRARVTLFDDTGNSRTVFTNSFGYFSFDNVIAGRTYVISIQSKTYRFPTRSLTVDDAIADFDFVALP